MTTRTREHTVEGETTSADVLATLDERDQNRVQLQKIRDFTVEPGLMELPVSLVTKAENSEKWAIEVEHPIEGTLRVYRDSPVTGWEAEDDNIVQLMEWYDVADPYELQLRHIFMRKTEDADQAHNWEPARPPDYEAPIPVQLAEKRRSIAEKMPELGPVMGWLVSLIYVAGVAYVVTTSISVDGLWALASATAMHVAATFLVMMLAPPPEQ